MRACRLKGGRRAGATLTLLPVTAVTINMGGERFRASGLVVEQANYLEVSAAVIAVFQCNQSAVRAQRSQGGAAAQIYKYEKWIARNLPQMAVGETYAPTSCTLRSKQTQVRDTAAWKIRLSELTLCVWAPRVAATAGATTSV